MEFENCIDYVFAQPLVACSKQNAYFSYYLNYQSYSRFNALFNMYREYS
jgi:hypothetical protein